MVQRRTRKISKEGKYSHSSELVTTLSGCSYLEFLCPFIPLQASTVFYGTCEEKLEGQILLAWPDLPSTVPADICWPNLLTPHFAAIP